MTRFKAILLAATFVGMGTITQAQAGTISYSGYTVLNNQTVSLSGIVNEQGGSGQITLNTTNTIGGMIATWCIDVLHTLQGSGEFTTGGFLEGAVGNRINALLSHVDPAKGPDASSALQVAIWRTEYGSSLTVTAPAGVTSLADTYLANIGDAGIWTADPTKRVAVLDGGTTNQSQAFLVDVPEPASIALLLGGLLGSTMFRRRPARH